MNLGQLEEENTKFINSYKELGYSTKTQLANDAFRLLRREKAKLTRKQWLTDAFQELSSVKSDVVFESTEGEEFVDKKW